MSQYIPNWINLPNPEPHLSGIKYRHAIDENCTYTITASLFNSANDNISYNGIYNTPEYNSVSGSEKVGICEKKLGIEAEHYINDRISCLVGAGFLWDDVTYSRTSITIYSDDSSVTRDINTSGNSRGGYLEGSLRFKPKTDKKFAKNISVILTGSLKSNCVGTSGTEKATDSYDVSGNWEDSKNMDFDMTRADLNFEIRYSFGEK
jgi:hypothetical protein